MVLSEAQQEILRTLAERYSASTTPIDLSAITHAADAGQKQLLQAALSGLVDGEFVRSDGRHVQLTLDGWLATALRDDAWRVIHGALALSRELSTARRGVPRFDWGALAARLGMSDERRAFAWAILCAAQLGEQAGYNSNGVSFVGSEDHERWDGVQSLEDFLAIFRREDAERLVRPIRLWPHERVVAQTTYEWFMTHGEWPATRELHIEMNDRGIDLATVVKASFVVRGADLEVIDGRTYLTLHGIAALLQARAELDATMASLRVLGERYASAREVTDCLALDVFREAGIADAALRVRVLAILERQGGPFVVHDAHEPERATIEANAQLLECRRLATPRAFVTWLHQVWGGPPPAAVPPTKRRVRLTGGELPTFKGTHAWSAPPPTDFASNPKYLDGVDGVDVLLMTANQHEQNAALRAMSSPPGEAKIVKLHLGRVTYFIGCVGDSLVALVKSRIGAGMRDGAGPTADEAIRRCHPRAVIAVGIGWGMNTNHKIGDVLVSTRVIPFDPQRREAGKSLPRAGQPEAGATLLNRFLNVTVPSFVRPDGYRCKRIDGPLLTGETLVNDPDVKARWHEQYHDAIGGEMEGSGIYGATANHGGDWIIVKAISDWGDGSKGDDYQPLAATSAMSLVSDVISDQDTLHGLRHMGIESEPARRKRSPWPVVLVAILAGLVLALGLRALRADRTVITTNEQLFETAASRPLNSLSVRLHYGPRPNQGQAGARNVGIRISSTLNGISLVAALNDDASFLGSFARRYL